MREMTEDMMFGIDSRFVDRSGEYIVVRYSLHVPPPPSRGAERIYLPVSSFCTTYKTKNLVVTYQHFSKKQLLDQVLGYVQTNVIARGERRDLYQVIKENVRGKSSSE